MTASPRLAAPPDWIPTGNLQIALPHISRLDAGVYSAGVTSLKDNALLELCGDEAAGLPFLRPLLELEGDRLALADLRWERLDGWLPRFHCQVDGLEISGTIFAPLDEKGFVYLLEVTSVQDCQLHLGVEGGGKASTWWSSRPARWRRVGRSGRIAGPAAWWARREAGCQSWPGVCSPTGRPSLRCRTSITAGQAFSI